MLKKSKTTLLLILLAGNKILWKFSSKQYFLLNKQ